jgi:hypothetical protein
LNRELRFDQMVNVTMSCFDLTNSSNNANGDALFKFRLRDEPEENTAAADEPTTMDTREVRLPRRIVFEDVGGPEKLYHVRHLMTIARMLASKQEPYNLTFDDALVSVKLVDTVPELERGQELRLIRVKDYCRALLSDYDCREHRVASYLPHTPEQIKTCVDIWLHNLVMFHSFFNLSSVQLNASAIASSCFADTLLMSGRAGASEELFATAATTDSIRTVKCFHEPETTPITTTVSPKVAAALAINVKKYWENMDEQTMTMATNNGAPVRMAAPFVALVFTLLIMRRP